MRTVWRRIGGMLAAVLMLAGCSTAPSSGARTMGRSPTPHDPPTAHHPPATLLPDRDTDAVIAGLRQLDACALLDPVAAAVPGYPGNLKPRSQGPHRCLLTRKHGDDEVRVLFADRFTTEARFNQAPLTLSGAKAYLWTSQRGDICIARLPVSFELAIEFSAARGVQSTGGDLCTAAQGFAGAAAAKLANPDTVAAGESMPMAQRDACTVLRAALGDTAARSSVRVGGFAGLDGCEADLSGGNGRSVDPELHLTLQYGPDPASEQGPTIDTIGGRRVRIYDDRGCTLAWSEGPSRSADPHAMHQQVELRASDCAAGRPLAASVIAVLQSAPPFAAPQRPLLYRPDEPDAAAPGGCIDMRMAITGPCQPAVAVPLPSGAAAILAAAKADPNVHCAIALDALRRHLGPTLTPVTSGRDCLFVEPTHTVEISVSSDRHTKLVYHDGHGDEHVKHARTLTVSGHLAVYYERDSVRGTEYVLNMSSTRGSDAGVVFCSAIFYPARGAPPRSAADTSRSVLLEPVIADIATRFLE